MHPVWGKLMGPE